MSPVVTIVETGSIRERVCNDFSRTEPDPCAQQSSRVISKELPWNSATENLISMKTVSLLSCILTFHSRLQIIVELSVFSHSFL